MKMDELRGAFPAMPDATRSALLGALRALPDSDLPDGDPRVSPRKGGFPVLSLIPAPSRRMRGLRLSAPVLALILALALAGAAAAATTPHILRWLLGPGETPSAELEAIARPLHVAQTAGDLSVRLTGYVTDGQELALSVELESADPTRPAFVVLSSVRVGEKDVTRHVLSAAYDAYKWVPMPYLDVLPAQRNPAVYGFSFYVGDLDLGESAPEAPVTATLHILRPTLPFVIVDELMHGGLEAYDATSRAEIQDVFDTLLAFEGTVVAGADDMDPLSWSARGYIPVDHHCELLTEESLLDLVFEEAAITLSFTADLSGATAYLAPDISVDLGDCRAVLRRASLSPMSTALTLDLIPEENAPEAAALLGERYGALILCDADGEALQYLPMDWIMTDRGYAKEADGRWVCRYDLDMPGLAAFPEQIRLRLTGEGADPSSLERFEEAMVVPL